MTSIDIKALVITVNYKGCRSTLNFVDSISSAERFSEIKVVIVDNASNDGSAETIRGSIARFGNIELLESPTNLGYFPAARLGLERYLSRAELPEWIIVCNNDITFPDKKFLANLFERNQPAAIIGPAIIPELTGVDCNPFLRKRPSKLRIMRYRLFLSNYYLNFVIQALAPSFRILRYWLYSWRRAKSSTGPTQIYAAHGAFIIFGRQYFERRGYIDDGCFLYYEEFSVAEICLRLGLTIMHDPRLKIGHEGHQAVGRILTRATFSHQREGFHYALAKYLRHELHKPSH